MFRFQAIAMSCSLSGPNDPVSYGILAERDSQNGWIPVTVAADVSFDHGFVSILAEKCTHLQLNPIHLADVVTDTLYEALYP